MERIIIKANSSAFSLNLREIYHYKDLLLTLARRDLKVKYAQTFLGFLWAFIQPALTVLIFTLIFGKAVKINTDPIPYSLFALTGMVAWTYFAIVMSQAGNSIIGSQNMVKKIYFPRLIIPLSKSLVGLVDLGIVLSFLFAMFLFYSYLPSSNIFFLPFFVILLILCALGAGIWLSALTIRYRDFQYIIPFMVQVGLYTTPVGYPSSLIPEKYQLLYHLNPVVGIVEGFRWSILGYGGITQYTLISFSIVIVLFISSLFYFRKVEKVMADIV